MTAIYCDNEKCKYQEEGICKSSFMVYAHRLCQTYRAYRTQDLMAAPYNCRCAKHGGKYRSTDKQHVK